MRRCIRCNAEMVEGLEVRDSTGHMLEVIRPGTSGTLSKNRFGEIKASVCPQCGYVEAYLLHLDKIQQYKTE